MEQIDRTAIKEWNIPSAVLMENAGRNFTRLLQKELRPLPRNIIVLAGKGNNGGDGLVIARCLIDRGKDVTTFVLGEKEDLSQQTHRNAKILERITDKIYYLPSTQIDDISSALVKSKLVIDALLGVGIQGEVRGYFAQVIPLINQQDKTIVSVDLPSGLPSDTGNPDGVCVKADLTITMGLIKAGLILPPGPSYAGELRVAPVGYPQKLIDSYEGGFEVIDDSLISEFLPPRPPYGHKGTFGKLLVVAGSTGMTGAATLATRSAMRCGTGLVYLGIPRSLNKIMESQLVEALTVPLAEKRGYLTNESLSQLLTFTKNVNAIVVGPGLSRKGTVTSLIRDYLTEVTVPKVVDADGINAFQDHEDKLEEISPAVITPHPGELGRLLEKSPETINKNRLTVGPDVAKKFGLVVVLKGVPTVIADSRGNQYILNCPNSGLAKGGSGDILTGLIGGLMAQGLDPLDAAVGGVGIHSHAAQRSSEVRGVRGIIPTDVVDQIPYSLKEIETNG